MDLSYSSYLRSSAWRHKRADFLRRLGPVPRCQGCGCLAVSRRMNWHHLMPNTWPGETLEDVRFLCPSCHARAHGRRSWPGREGGHAG